MMNVSILLFAAFGNLLVKSMVSSVARYNLKDTSLSLSLSLKLILKKAVSPKSYAWWVTDGFIFSMLGNTLSLGPEVSSPQESNITETNMTSALILKFFIFNIEAKFVPKLIYIRRFKE